jgi:hypothetical protein
VRGLEQVPPDKICRDGMQDTTSCPWSKQNTLNMEHRSFEPSGTLQVNGNMP